MKVIVSLDTEDPAFCAWLDREQIDPHRMVMASGPDDNVVGYVITTDREADQLYVPGTWGDFADTQTNFILTEEQAAIFMDHTMMSSSNLYFLYMHGQHAPHVGALTEQAALWEDPVFVVREHDTSYHSELSLPVTVYVADRGAMRDHHFDTNDTKFYVFDTPAEAVARYEAISLERETTSPGESSIGASVKYVAPSNTRQVD